MIQLWAWEYEGKAEVGWRHGERTSFSLFVVQDSLVLVNRDISQVTDLRKVKVVDEDAVQERTSADGLWVHDGKEWRTRYAMWRGKPLKTKEDWDNYYIAINPPITEPKNFGAIVEAGAKKDYRTTQDLPKTLWVFDGLYWWSQGRAEIRKWSDLINPTIISEGVEG